MPRSAPIPRPPKACSCSTSSRPSPTSSSANFSQRTPRRSRRVTNRLDLGLFPQRGKKRNERHPVNRLHVLSLRCPHHLPVGTRGGEAKRGRGHCGAARDPVAGLQMLEVRHQPDLQARARRTLDVATPDLPPTTSSVLGGRIVRRFLVAVGVISLVVACGGSRSSSTSIRAACIAGNGYGGLGGRADAFDANNNDSPGPSGPTPGTAWY